jgi:sulfate transport system permease protein
MKRNFGKEAKMQQIKKLPFFIVGYLIFILIIPLGILITQGLKANIFDIVKIASDPIALHTYWITLKLAFIATCFNVIFGLVLAWVLVRYDFFGREFLDICVDLPFALPTAVAGLTLSFLYGNQGFITSFETYWSGFTISSEVRVCLAMIFVSLPFVIRTVQPVLQSMNVEYEEVACVLGASDWDIFEQITFPRIRASLFSGASLSLSRSLGEYGSIVILSSNLPFDDLVTPVLIFQKLEQYDYTSASIIGVTILLLSLSILFLLGLFQSIRFS